MSSCILHRDKSLTSIVIDVPKSIEQAQGRAWSRKLLSSEPGISPLPSLEPKSSKAVAKLGSPSISDLVVQKHLELALAEIKVHLRGGWCLHRVTEENHLEPGSSSVSRISKKASLQQCEDSDRELTPSNSAEFGSRSHIFTEGEFLFQNDLDLTCRLQFGLDGQTASIPPGSVVLQGAILTTRETFCQHAPEFDLIIVDPPWPNRSARRKGVYGISHSTSEIEKLLSCLPVREHLDKKGLVGVWVTNRMIFRDLTLKLFSDWGVTLAEEWVWLKVTSGGQPVYPLDGVWRKPYETLLVGSKSDMASSLKRRVIVGVPDLHSRKPNLRYLFEEVMGKNSGEYEALEIFARNLTEGWWGWGSEVLRFQQDEWWKEEARTNG